jgi:hypothetical protein
LVFLGIPWFYSSDSGLFKGLQGFQIKIKYTRPPSFPAGGLQ